MKNKKLSSKPKVGMKKPSLKLYVWTKFQPDYTGGLAFAVARSEVSAKKQILKSNGREVYAWGILSVHKLTSPISFSVSGGG